LVNTTRLPRETTAIPKKGLIIPPDGHTNDGPARAPAKLDIEALLLHFGPQGIPPSLFAKIVTNGFE
jgi:hypothetical protein